MISSYQNLISAAHSQPEAQRLLFVFCRAELPDDADVLEQAGFARGEGGALTPVICVDKAVNEAESFPELVAESNQTGQHWDIVFIAALSGRGGVAPGSDEAQQPLAMMVEGIRSGHIGHYVAANRNGEFVKIG